MAVLEQERHVEYVSGTLEHFVITSTMISATSLELPHLKIFVLTVNDRIDPKADTLARVARIADLTTLPLGRDAGLASAAGTGMEFLSQSVIVNYTTLTEAEDAKQAIQDRVNALIQDWNTFVTDFNAPDPSPEFITLPTTDPSQKNALIAAYRTAKETRYTAQQTKTAADTALTSANAAYTAAATTAGDFANFVATSTVMASQMNTAAAAMATLTGAGGTFYGTASGDPPSTSDKATFITALTAASLQVDLNNSYQMSHAAFAGALTSYLNGTLTPAKAAASATLTTAQATQIAAAQALTSAQATESAALAAVLTICPDFQSNSICQVPG